MKIEIEDYRGWTIYFDTEKERFYSLSQSDDIDKENKSFSAARKAIDDYLTENVDFKPFEVFYGGYGGRDTPKRKVLIYGRAKNGKLMAEDQENGKYQISKYDLGRYIFQNPDNDAIYAQIEEVEQQIKEAETRVGELRSSLKIRTLESLTP